MYPCLGLTACPVGPFSRKHSLAKATQGRPVRWVEEGKGGIGGWGGGDSSSKSHDCRPYSPSPTGGSDAASTFQQLVCHERDWMWLMHGRVREAISRHCAVPGVKCRNRNAWWLECVCVCVRVQEVNVNLFCRHVFMSSLIFPVFVEFCPMYHVAKWVHPTFWISPNTYWCVCSNILMACKRWKDQVVDLFLHRDVLELRCCLITVVYQSRLI